MTDHEKENPESDILARLEAEMSREPQVFGTGDDIAEALSALVEAIATFGKTAEDGMVNAINEAQPFLKEMDDTAREMIDAKRDGLTEKATEIREWFDALEPERVVDCIAEGVKVAQTYLQQWMDDHGIKAMSLLIPNMDRTGAKEVTFGLLTDVEAEFPHLAGAQINMVATTPVKKARPVEDGPATGGYL